MAIVPGVLLDHVQIDPAQRGSFVGGASTLGARTPRVQLERRDRAPSTLDAGLVRRQDSVGDRGIEVLERRVRRLLRPVPRPGGEPSKSWNHDSTPVMCRTSPSSDSRDGGQDRSTS